MNRFFSLFDKKNIDFHEFQPILAEIEHRPLNPLGRFIFWVVISSVLILGIGLYLAETDVVISARGIVTHSRSDGNLAIDARVANRDIGLLKKGMAADLKIDAFNFQRYGVLKAIVGEIEPIRDPILGPAFKVEMVPEKWHLTVRGEDVELFEGLTLTAELKMGRRRVIEFFIYPLVKYLGDGVKVK